MELKLKVKICRKTWNFLWTYTFRHLTAAWYFNWKTPVCLPLSPDRVYKKLLRSWWRLCFEAISQFSWAQRRWPCLVGHSFISQFEGHVKEPTLLFKKSRRSFLNGVVGGRIAQIIHIMSWVGYGKLINGPITETSETVVCWRPS